MLYKMAKEESSLWNIRKWIILYIEFILRKIIFLHMIIVTLKSKQAKYLQIIGLYEEGFSSCHINLLGWGVPKLLWKFNVGAIDQKNTKSCKYPLT